MDSFAQNKMTMDFVCQLNLQSQKVALYRTLNIAPRWSCLSPTSIRNTAPSHTVQCDLQRRLSCETPLSFPKFIPFCNDLIWQSQVWCWTFMTVFSSCWCQSVLSGVLAWNTDSNGFFCRHRAWFNSCAIGQLRIAKFTSSICPLNCKRIQANR